MPRRITHRGRPGFLLLRMALAALALTATPVAAQDLPFRTDYPGAGAFECPAFAAPDVPNAEARAQAAQLASEASQSVILGDLDRARALLDRAVELDGAAADLAYRRARILEDLDEPDAAVLEYCRALARAGGGAGAADAAERRDALLEARTAELPGSAVEAMREGLQAADQNELQEALDAFELAASEAPEWPTAAYNRGVALARLGRDQEAAASLTRYLALRPDAPDAIPVSQRIGQLQSLSVRGVPSPGAALTLGVLVPGMGQFYSGRPLGGLTVLSIAGGAVAAGLLIKEVNVRCLTTGEPGETCPPSQVVSRTTERPYLMPGIGVAVAVGIAGAVEAFFDARERRGRARALPATSTQDAGATIAVRPDLSAHGGRVRLGLLQIRFR